MCEFCQTHFNKLLWQQITFKAYLLPGNQHITAKVTLFANGLFSVLITQGWMAMNNLC
jgi:hypothetical protein